MSLLFALLLKIWPLTKHCHVQGVRSNSEKSLSDLKGLKPNEMWKNCSSPSKSSAIMYTGEDEGTEVPEQHIVGGEKM